MSRTIRAEFFLLLLAIWLGACQSGGSSTSTFVMRTASLDTLDRVFTVPLKPAVTAVPRLAGAVGTGSQGSKIDPDLEQMLQDSSATKQVRLIVSFRDTVTIPRFPEPDMTLERDHTVNEAKRDTAKIIITDIQTARGAQVAADTVTLRSHGAVPQRIFWLTQSIVVTMQLGDVVDLATEPTVRYIEPAAVPAMPPQGEMPTGPVEVSAARDQINSDVYAALGLAYGWVAIFDTGVNTHKLLMVDETLDPAHVAGREDAVVDECCVESGDPVSDLEPDEGHGTSTMTVLTGNDRMGDDYEGVTSASVESFRVYWWDSDGNSHVCIEGTELAIERALGELDPVMVMEIDKRLGEGSVLITACNNAYTAGYSVISAAGNGSTGDLGVSAPSAAHRVIAVGAYQVNDDDRPAYSFGRHGDTDDGRKKPDVMAPTGTETGGIRGCSEGDECEDKRFYSGTSGATPYAAGAAVLWRNWLGQYEAPVDPGLVYAFLILSGRETQLDSARGAGPIRMPSDGWAWYGSVEIEAGESQPIEIEVPWEDVFAIEAAIWWPEDEEGAHSYHKLEILDPSGISVQEGSDDVNSVFQRATVGDPGDADGWSPSTGVSTVGAPLTTGTWTVQITRAEEPTYTQTVYYAIAARAAEPPSSTLMAAALDEADDEEDERDGTDGDDKDDGGKWWHTWVIVFVVFATLGVSIAVYLWRLKKGLGSG